MNIIKLILLYLFAFFGSYILTAFVQADLNFTNWPQHDRFLVVLFGFVPFFWLYNDRN